METSEREQNFITSLDLTHLEIHDDQPVEHFVYASSLYGTTFGVFCQVKGKTIDKHSFKIEALELRIINYVGVINIGFLKNNGRQLHNSYDIAAKTVFFAVQGANTNNKLRITVNGGLTIKKGFPVTLTFNRRLHPLKEFARINKNVEDRTRQSEEAVPLTPLFDTEFNYRNGVDLYFNLLRPGMLGFVEPTDVTPLPSPRCHIGFVRVVFP